MVVKNNFKFWNKICGILLLCMALAVCLNNTFAQAYTTLTFTGKSSLTQENIPLHHVEITDVTQHWEEGLYYPDTILQFGSLGIGDYDENGSVLLLQNVPNPFDGITVFTLRLPRSMQVSLEIYNMEGQKLVNYSGHFSAGFHQFRAVLSSPQTYFLNAKTEGGQMTIKMINKGLGGDNNLIYLGGLPSDEKTSLKLNASKGTTPLPFMLGDIMIYTGHFYSNGHDYVSQIVQHSQWGSEVITLSFEIGSAKVHTKPVTNVEYYSATCGGNITDNGNMNIIARGVCWGTSPNPTVNDSYTTNGIGMGSFNSNLTGLSQNTTYYVRAYAANDLDTVYGEEEVFTTLQVSAPSVTTANPTEVSYHTATCGGTVYDFGGAEVTSRGVCWDTTHNPTIISGNITNNGMGTGTYTSDVTNLTPGVTYYVRAYAINSAGPGYGDEKIFTTLSMPDGDAQPCPGAATVTDIDGNVYNTVKIGSQCWMKENLKTTKYADGTNIPHGSTSSIVANWYYPNNNSSNKPTYGLLYNWKAVMRNNSSSSSNPSGIQGVCPTGWHVPSEAEWTQLKNYVSSQTQYLCGGAYIAKALASTTGWYASNYSVCEIGYNLNTNNITGFSAMPAGIHDSDNHYTGFGTNAYFWSATEHYTWSSGCCWLYYSNPNVIITGEVADQGFSVRCVRNENQSYNPPTVTTFSVSITSSTTATSGGNVTNAGGADVTVRGVCWGTSPNPTVSDSHTTNGSGVGTFTSSLTGLSLNTTYFIRAYAINSVDTAYGEEFSFSIAIPSGDAQPCPGTATLNDRDGNIYNTVKIGSQCWMKENLKTTKYADGTSIPQGTGSSDVTGYWYYPGRNSSNMSTYGLLYNWKAVMRNSASSSANPSGVQGICPTGWHVPSDAEWTQLVDYVSSHICYVCEYAETDNSSIAKSLAATTGWLDYYSCAAGNMQGNNATGFSALPAGSDIYIDISFTRWAYFYSSTESSSDSFWEYYLCYGYDYVSRITNSKSNIGSIRCVRN